MKRLLFIVLILLSVFAPAYGEVWTNRLEISDRQALATLPCNWSKSGLKLQLVATNHATIEFRLAADRSPDVRLIPERLFPDNFEDAIHVWPVSAPATNRVIIALRRQSHAWMLYVDDAPVARFPEPWVGAVTIRHPVGALPAGDSCTPYVQRTAAFRFDDTFMVAQTTTNQFPVAWERMYGDWHLHSVTGGVSGAMSKRKLARQPTPERSPNFYSLEGCGPHGIVLAGEPFYHGYSFRASVQHNGGTNGLVFLVTDTGACHGFTAFTDPQTERLVFQLWQGGIAPFAPRQVRATIATELLAGQWTLMEVRVFDDRVICLANNIEILCQRLPLPSGGRFGLIDETDQSTRFDDVSVSSHEDYPFESLAELQFHTLRQNGTFCNAVDEKTTSAGGAVDPLAFESPGDRKPREWIFGATDDGPHKLELCFQPPAKEDFACSLIAGWQGPALSYYQFTCRSRGDRRIVALERVSAANVITLDSADLEPCRGPLRLTLDALRPNELRGLVNGRLVVMDRPAEPLAGAGGMRLEGRGSIRFALPQYTSREPIYADRLEKNPAFVNDPFMRLWAAPEGQWITMRDGLTWLRGDIMGRAKVRLPVVDPSVLHLAIPEGETNGQCTVVIRGGMLSVRTSATGTNAAFTVKVVDIPEEEVEKVGKLRFYTVNFEDRLLWISSEAALLGRCHLPPLVRARRARIEGLTLDQLHQTQIQRENVFDTLFNESLFNWTLNGGTWEVVNRFQCEPTWSHMNGESTNSFAGLWSNVEMSGDFCVEFYAGTRMGWYDRPGDFNLTVHSRRQATCDGYSVTLSGWDPDHSQLFTRLFRNGELEAVSTAYTAPRVRDGSVRGGYDPLVPGGRPVHGAWYGMRFRRVGDQLSYLFDNEPILSWRDPAPLDAGSLGIWTYRNSIMVARVRIAAESVRPRPFRFWTVDNATTFSAPESATVPEIRVNGRPAELLDPAVWQEADAVSRPLVHFSRSTDGHAEMRVTALEGAGSFLVAPHLPLIPAPKLLGWHFEVARHPETRFSFEFSAGRHNETNSEAVLNAVTRYSFVICGSDDPRGERRIAGRLAQPPAASQPDASNRNCVWTPVDVWLPAEATHKDLSIRIDGFGNLQPGDIQQGLVGNPPGAWYSLRNFHEIYSAIPEIDGPSAQRTELDAFAMKAAQCPRGILNVLRLPATLDAREPVMAWAARSEAEFGLGAHSDPLIPDAVRVSSTFPWASPLLPARSASVDGQLASGWQDGNDYVVLLPRSPVPHSENTITLQLELADGRTFRQPVTLATVTNEPPVLLACEMPEGGIQTFESRTVDAAQYQGRAGFVFSCTDPQQGATINFQNAGATDARLDGRLLPRYDPVITPLLQFRYKADPMAHVSLTAGRCNTAFSEHAGMLVAPTATGVLDNAWHTWMGAPIQTVSNGLLRNGWVVSPSELRVGSRSVADQTGQYSAIAFDDIARGPVLGLKHPWSFRLNYSDRKGVADVRYAIAAGSAPWTERSGAEQAAQAWLAVTNQQVVVPDLSALPEGPYHLFTQAQGGCGVRSAVYDIPLILACHPPQVSFGVRAVPDRYNGTCLDIHINGTVAPPLVRKLRLSFEGQPLDLTTDNGQFSYSNNAIHLELDWPWLLRKTIRNCKDGDTLTLTLDGISDAAGNDAPVLQIPIELDLANDKRPPAVLPLQNTTNLLVYAPQFHGLQDFFTGSQQMTAMEPQKETGFQFVPFRCQGGDNATLSRQFNAKPWDPEAFPWLAISVRLDGDFAAGTAPFGLRLHPSGTLPEQAIKPKDGKDAYLWRLPIADNQPFVVGHVDWKPGQWVDLLVNVRDLLRDQSHLAKACAVKEVALVFPPKAKFTLHVRGMAILAPWGVADVLKFKAYDLNSIGGLVWQSGGKSTRTGIRPARLTLPPEDAQWLKLRLSDGVGNLTPIFMVPMPPNAAPLPEDLPLEVDVEDL